MDRRHVVPVPSSLLGPLPADDQDEPVVILGAGCAGLTLAVQLRRQGLERPIVLIDRRTEYAEDRSWCFWSSAAHPAAALASASWDTWAVRTHERAVLRSRRGSAYRQVRFGDFIDAALRELADAGGVRLLLGEPVSQLTGRPGLAPVVTTSEGPLHPSVLIDARGPRTDRHTVEQAARDGVWLGQEFLGLRVRTARAVFDPSTCELMDFRCDQDRGPRFLYVLPVSATEALVESVHFSSEPEIEVAGHRERIHDHLQRRFRLTEDEIQVVAEERGCIPMTDSRPAAVLGPRHYAVGLAGGAVRPSTGYAFLRIQRSCTALAASIVAGRDPVDEIDGRRRRLLDDVFLRFLVQHPAQVPQVFARMFARTPSASLIRFLSDESRLLDDLLLIAALPKAPFLRILAGMALGARGARVEAGRVLAHHAR